MELNGFEALVALGKQSTKSFVLKCKFQNINELHFNIFESIRS